VFEGRGGYFAAVTHAPCELAPFGGGGQAFKIMECLTKRFPLGQYSQSVAEAAIAVRGQLAAGDEIDGVLVETLGRALKIMADSPEKWRPANTETADHSLPYVTAVALLHGPVERCHFDEEYLRDARLLDLVSRVKCSAWPEADGREPGTMLCRITVTTKAGARHAATVEYHRGHAKNPMSDGEIEAKFRALAEPVLARAQCDALLDRLWNLEGVGNARELFPLFRTTGQ
jgi:2-methylcitrate dehydratase